MYSVTKQKNSLHSDYQNDRNYHSFKTFLFIGDGHGQAYHFVLIKDLENLFNNLKQQFPWSGS